MSANVNENNRRWRENISFGCSIVFQRGQCDNLLLVFVMYRFFQETIREVQKPDRLGACCDRKNRMILNQNAFPLCCCF